MAETFLNLNIASFLKQNYIFIACVYYFCRDSVKVVIVYLWNDLICFLFLIRYIHMYI